MTQKIVAAIDGSLTSSGIIIGTYSEILYAGKFCTTSDMTLPKRLWMIYRHMQDLFKEYDVSELAFESKFFNPNKDPQGALNLGRVDGSIMMAAETLGIPCDWYAPSSIKKIVTGKGNCGKDDVQAALETRFKEHPVVAPLVQAKVLNPKTGRMVKNKVDDVWDGIGIWYTHTTLKSGT